MDGRLGRRKLTERSMIYLIFLSVFYQAGDIAVGGITDFLDIYWISRKCNKTCRRKRCGEGGFILSDFLSIFYAEVKAAYLRDGFVTDSVDRLPF